MAVVALAVMPCRADWESGLKPSLYSVTFADYADGETLSDKGAEGGSWGDPAVPVDGKASVTSSVERIYLNYETSSVGLVFTNWQETAQQDGPKMVRLSWKTTGAEELPSMVPGTDKAGFTVYTPANGEASFMGWSAQGWQALTLPSGAVVPQANAWYEVSIWVGKNFENKIMVQYRLKVGKDYEPLQTASGAVWLEAGAQDDSVIREVEARGIGALENLSGKELPSPGVNVRFR